MSSQRPVRTIIAGAAGRDFHDFNTAFRQDDSHQVVAFTATQIPNIDGRLYPRHFLALYILKASPSIQRAN